jgi:hypothetical protein
MTQILYRGYHIRHDPPPIPIRTCDWQWYHEDYDPTPLHSYGPPSDDRSGASASLDDAKADIDDQIAEVSRGSDLANAS